jgi:lipoprotein-anchoring transpeptidase ErfK/SrfK
MRLISLFIFRNLPFHLIAAGLLAALLVAPANAEPSGATDSQGEVAALSSQPQPVYPDGDPSIETLNSDPDMAIEEPQSKVVVTIDKGIQEMTVWVDGREKYSWPVSTGIGGYSTPSGNFTASSMNKIWYSRQWDNAPMPHAIFFTKKGHAIHATNETKKLGTPASHGCVRLSPKNAATLFALVKEKGLKNTEVVLVGVSPGGEYKITQPRRRPRGEQEYFDRYGYYDGPPPGRRRATRRRLFQPYYEARPQQRQPQQRRGRRWFRAPGRY